MNIKLNPQTSMFSGRLLVWFSCGAASACALKLLSSHNPTAVYCNTLVDEHPDNARFLHDVEVWTGIKIQIIQSKFFTTTDEVFEKTRYMSGPDGARCTTELKKLPRFAFQYPEDIHAFGFTADEVKRIKNFESDNFDMNLTWPLLENGVTKKDCYEMVGQAGIKLPVMYSLGFKNNNCIGCVKATSAAYWNLTRQHFPERFAARSKQSRAIGCKLVQYQGKRIYLDELPIKTVKKVRENVSCGPQCGAS